MSASVLWLALALVLVLEGAFPFLAPKAWRSVFERLLQLSDEQIRIYAAVSISAGLLVICFFTA